MALFASIREILIVMKYRFGIFPAVCDNPEIFKQVIL